ncbi:MAG: hypothetical protein V4548_01820 [Bacteroidota bacterium]
MKKKILFLSVLCGLVFVSCEKKAEKETVIEKETVVVPGETQEMTPPPTEKNPDGTSVEIGKNGVSVSSKDGTNSTQVKVSRDTSKVIIKK